MSCFYLKISDTFLIVHVQFENKVKFQLLALFPVVHLPPPVVSSLLHWFATFAYYMINHCVSIHHVDYTSIIIIIIIIIIYSFLRVFAQSAGAVEYILHLCRGVRPSSNECPGYDTKQSNSEVPVMLGLWEMRSTLSLPLLPGPLGPAMIAPDRALSMG